MKVLTTIKSLTVLDLDLMDSNEAMLVLNNLPNVQILNGRSTKDEDDDDEEEDENNDENDDTDNKRNNHLYPQMEEIEEDKNMENNSNYVSNENNNTNNNNSNNNNTNNNNTNNNNSNNNNSYNNNTNNNNTNSKDNNSYGTDNKDLINGNNNFSNNNNQTTNVYTQKITITEQVRVIDGKEYSQKNIEINKEGPDQPNMLLYDKIISDNSNKNLLPNSNNENQSNNINDNNNNDNYNNNNVNNNDINKNNELYNDTKNMNNINDDNKNNGNFLIDITDEELNSLKEDKYSPNSECVTIIKDFVNIFGAGEEKDEEYKLYNIFLNKLKKVEEKKQYIPNYYYFYLLYKKKIKILKSLLDEFFPYILNKCPEINNNNILTRINKELSNSIKDSKDLILAMHLHIEEFNNKKNDNDLNDKNDNNNSNNNKNNNEDMTDLINEKDNKIASLESQKDDLLKNINEDKKAYEKKIASLEKENKIMTEKLLDKANNIINEPHSAIRENDRGYGAKPIGFRNHSQSPPKSLDNSNFENNRHKRNINNNINNNRSKSPIRLNDNTITLDNNNSINYINTNNNMNSNTNKHQISLKSLKDFINELYISKTNYDMKCLELKLPRETLEEHMYTFLNKKYGLKNLIIDWARSVINGIKYYSKKDSQVLLFGKIMRNEQEEEARFIIQKVSESIEELLLYYIKRQNPLKSVNEINKIFERKKNYELFEEEWKGIIYSIYEKNEANEIEKKIDNFINKENEKKKIEMFKKYKDSRLNNNKHNKYNNIVNNTNNNNNSYNLNTINTYNNTVNNTSPNNNITYMNTINNGNNTKLSRIEKYNMLLFPDEKNILFSDFLKIVLDNHIRFRDRQLKNFVKLFKSVDTNKDGSINEEEFGELIQRMKIFKEDEVENKIFIYLEKIDPFDNQKITFSECVSFFSGEIIKDNDVNGNEKEITVLEKVCFNGDPNGNGNTGFNNTNESNDNEHIETNNELNNNIGNKPGNNNDISDTI